MDPLIGLSLARVAFGSAAVADPRLVLRYAGLDAEANPQLPYMTRLFGARDAAIGATALLLRGRARKTVVLGGIAVDASDAAAGVLAMGDKSLSTRAGAGVVTPAALAVVAGVASLRWARRARHAG